MCSKISRARWSFLPSMELTLEQKCPSELEGHGQPLVMLERMLQLTDCVNQVARCRGNQCSTA